LRTYTIAELLTDAEFAGEGVKLLNRTQPPTAG
jgi:hypothetical protein